MNIEAVGSVLRCIRGGPLDGASPLWNKGVITCPTYARGEPPCKHGSAMTSCPVLPTRWISSRTFCVSVAKLVSPLRRSTFLHRSSSGSLLRQNAKRWAGHCPAVIAHDERGRRGAFPSCPAVCNALYQGGRPCAGRA